MRNPNTAEAVAGAYYVLQLQPWNTDDAEAILVVVERALAHSGSQRPAVTDSAR
jgi:hypothetical protein